MHSARRKKCDKRRDLQLFQRLVLPQFQTAFKQSCRPRAAKIVKLFEYPLCGPHMPLNEHWRAVALASSFKWRMKLAFFGIGPAVGQFFAIGLAPRQGEKVDMANLGRCSGQAPLCPRAGLVRVQPVRHGGG